MNSAAQSKIEERWVHVAAGSVTLEGNLSLPEGAGGIVDRDKINLVIDSAVERGLTQKPVDPDQVIDFSFAQSVR